MKTEVLVSIDQIRGVWVMEYRDEVGELVFEQTAFPSHMRSLVVCDELLKERPKSTLFAGLN